MDINNKEPLTVLAYLYLEHFKYDKALNLLKALNILYPEDTNIKRSLSFAYLKSGDYQSALVFAEKAIRPDIAREKQIAAHLIKGKALWGLGKEEAARHALNQASRISLEISPKFERKSSREEIEQLE